MEDNPTISSSQKGLQQGGSDPPRVVPNMNSSQGHNSRTSFGVTSEFVGKATEQTSSSGDHQPGHHTETADTGVDDGSFAFK
jgi:hypothetical protein